MRKIQLLFGIILISLTNGFAQTQLSVEHIMQDPKWMGNFPSSVSWDEQGKNIYFNYNPEGNPADSLYKININATGKIEKVSLEEQKKQVPRFTNSNLNQSKKLFVEDGNIILFEVATNSRKTVLNLGERISSPKFLANEDLISFEMSSNLYVMDLKTGKIEKKTNIKSGNKPVSREEQKMGERETWLKKDNLELLQVVKEREEAKEASKIYREAIAEEEKFAHYLGTGQAMSLQLSPDEKYATFLQFIRAENKRTVVPDYTHASGYTTDINTRSKVGDEASKVELFIYDIDNEKVYKVSTSDLEGITDLPDYTKDYPEKTWEAKERSVSLGSPIFSPNGKHAIVNIRSDDNKDRWIARINLEDGSLKVLDRQRDEAWVAGPGIGSSFGGGTLGWLPDNKHIYFQSEETGYSHLYLLDVNSGSKRALTNGQYEVFSPFISKDMKSWYLTTSEVHAGERHFYRMPLMGGKMEKLTSMTGNNDVSLSPDEKHIAILYSYSNKPWELYLKPNDTKSEAKQLTNGQSEAFKAYNWRDPELVAFKAQDGANVPARLYKPEPSKSNGAAVIFVHGAGYLQNVHKWWSSYFREYMFHNLLTDMGYTVLDIDYRGSAGYGRDWRTGIYRHMGGKDLSDQVDGANFLISEHGVQAGKIGIYGGSYGGFITLMALFNAADTFTSGAALRSVTDWAHYNHGYTSNILNEPFNDPIAYKRSSPIYFAEGLKGNLLIAHGMIDVNVHFQDVVRLAQRLIELGKDNWEMAVYPVEDHGFVEPSSWTDEYKRILKLFNDTLLD
ncbi:prolyl oligopeptidase family serine peptidase [Belliella kenyensis]|uniref:Prolyl oligopeptidase family serine peptidase n=1 Tax=Belliella kenyensis TaxID=1472724 RepID=A0ABV8EL40_9BACT|nr:prolyl oligopeptidase family serine peptidase [Belliella kenyensis]MCH7400351.1 prolyl oligopeptidase family serine peptidase [Belliella kenyensis]MDN3604631.1 prolyl oligopeptidase family serine peptidase [Belliella kenyensis]